MLLLIVVMSSFSKYNNSNSIVAFTSNPSSSSVSVSAAELLKMVEYSEVDSAALFYALKGYINIQQRFSIRTDRLIVIDFSKPSTDNRFFLINPETGEVMYKSVVAHGKNSGQLFANRFSNTPGSHKSSLGFYRVGETYHGKHGKSLKLDGLEYGINHRARSRAIVIHSADYANPSFAVGNGFLGRSFGCPSLPENNYDWIVNEINNGTLLFIYHPTQYKPAKSKWV